MSYRTDFHEFKPTELTIFPPGLYSDKPQETQKPYSESIPKTVSGFSQPDREMQSERIETASSRIDYWDDDPNLSAPTDDVEDDKEAEEDSPYPEVRAAVSNADDPDMPAGTLRAWLIGIVWAVLIPGMNQFFVYRYPSVTIGPIIAQLLSYPVGCFWAAVVPPVKIFGVQLNPGPFSIKEHVIITIMAGVGAGPAYATEIVVVQRIFYNQTYNFGFKWLIVMSTQLLGFSIGGIVRRFLVDPPSMIWPTNLVACTLFNTLHSQQYAGYDDFGGRSRESFFVYVLAVATLYYILPGYLFTALSSFTWVCWIRPNDVIVNQLFGYSHGLGMSLITFDWSQISYIGSPLSTPWWAEANVAVGFMFFFWILVPVFYYTNTWNSQYFPISSRKAYDNTGVSYNITRILNSDAKFDVEKYKAYSPMFLSATFAVSYGQSFAGITATFVHVILYYRHQIWRQTKRSLAEQPDIHARLMSVYRPVPSYWYAIIFVTMFSCAIICMELLSSLFHMPTWSLVLALGIGFFYVIPSGMIQAVTNQSIGLNVITELVAGYLLPGRPIAVMMFKTWGFNTMSQALNFSSDFKLGHYMKIPPRTMFCSQILATIIAGTVQLGVQSWMLSNIPDMCSPNQKDGFICPTSETFYTASVIWGVIGPSLQVSRGHMYYGLLFFFLIGAIMPCIFWFLNKRYPNSMFRYVCSPILFSCGDSIPPGTAVNVVSWAIVGFIFQHLIRKRNFNWWMKYNYVLSAALDSSIGIGQILIFFILQYPKNGTIGQDTVQVWWGNTVYTKTADYRELPLKTVAPGERFGPATW